jgi:stage V sporulation protein D (sporulation-specific penicillin-binding protein)
MNMPVNKIAKSRASIAIVAVILLVAIIGVRLLELCLFRFDEYQKKVIDQLTTEIKVSADRGLIYDANMNVLASNYTVYDISVSPSRINALVNEEKFHSVWSKYYPDSPVSSVGDVIADFLALTLDMDRDTIASKISKKQTLYATVKKGVEAEDAEPIMEFVDKLGLDDQIFIKPASKRYYPYSTLASHTIGFTGTDSNGLYGIEYYYDSILSGTDGKYIIARDAYGNEMPFDYESYIEAVDGNSVVTTIDMRVQAVLEKYLKESSERFDTKNSVSGIVMDINTGAILAMGSYPDFNLNSPFELSDYYMNILLSEGLEEGSDKYNERLGQLRTEMWKNKAVNTVYMPGSTFKIITVATTLEEKIANLTEQFYCSGSHLVPGYNRPIKCHKVYGHGSQTLGLGLQNSCNPVMMTLAERMGANTFYEYFKNFGYLEKTGIDLPGEQKGIFYSENAFGPVDLACASFGQNFGISMLQHIVGISAAVNGGNLVVPHIMDKIIDADGNVVQSFDNTVRRQVISQSTSDTICDILGDLTATQQNSKYAYVAGYRVGAKTGTTEKTDKRDENGEATLRVGSCVAFAPADDPKYIILIVNDEPTYAPGSGDQYGSNNAAPYASMIFEEILPMLGVEPVYTEEELKTITINVGNYVGNSRSNVEYVLNTLGCEYELVGDGNRVTAQTPAAGTSFTKSSGKIILYMGTEASKTEYTVPDVVGMNAASANQLIINSGFAVKINGVKNFGLGADVRVLSQSPAAGTKLKEGEVVSISVAYKFTEEE